MLALIPTLRHLVNLSHFILQSKPHKFRIGLHFLNTYHTV